MPNLSRCSQCSAEISAGAPQGICTRCLVGFALRVPDSLPAKPSNATSAPGEPAENPGDLPEFEVRRTGDYELLEEIARGGMGIVYRARQLSLGREVAVKVILAGHFAGREAALRFEAEAEAAAQLKHPNIIAIHGTGVHEGQPYFSMDYFPGGNLSGLVRERPLSPRHAAEMITKLAEAIHYAHERGILHRDLKPSNVLLNDTGQPVITDFGLARRLERKSFLTVTGQVMGSPSFMPPEQAGAKIKAGRYSDVYSLGGILFFLLTGRAPFLGETVSETLQRVLHTEPFSPHLLNPAVPPDLATICLKCLDKDPARRYATAQELATDLGRFARDEPILARPVSRLEKSWRWCRRRPGLAGALATAATMLLIVAVGSPIAALSIRKESQRAEQAVRKLNESLYAADIHLASQAVLAHNIPRALELLRGIEADPSRNSLRGWEWRHLVERCRSQAIGVLRGHATILAKVEFSPDDKLLASISEDGEVKLWDWAGQKVVDSWVAHPTTRRYLPWTPEHSLAFSPDGRWLATGGTDGWVRIWNSRTRDLITSLPWNSTPISALAFSPDSRWLAGGNNSNWIRLWDVAPAEPELLSARQSDTHGVTIKALLFLPDHAELVATGIRSLARWDVSDPRQPTKIPAQVSGSETLGLSPDRQWLVSNAADGQQLRAWRLPEFTVAREFSAGTSVSVGLAFSTDGGLLASAGSDGNVNMLDFPTGRELAVLHGHENELRTIAFSHRGRFVASAGSETTIRLWDADSAVRPPMEPRHGSKVQSICFLPDSARFVTVGQDAFGDQSVTRVKLWDRATLSVRATVTTPGAPIHNRLALSADGSLLAVNGDDSPNELCLLALPSLNSVTNFPGANPAFASDGALIWAEGTHLLRRASLADSLIEIGKAVSHIQVVAVSPDGLTAVSRGGYVVTGELDFWEVGKNQPPLTRVEHQGDVTEIVFSPNGKLLASAAWDRTVALWDVATRRLLKRLRGHRGDPNCVAFSADGRTLASGDGDGEVIFWDLSTLRQLAVLPAQPAGVTALSFSPDGQWLAIGGWSGTVRLWHAPPFEELKSVLSPQ